MTSQVVQVVIATLALIVMQACGLQPSSNRSGEDDRTSGTSSKQGPTFRFSLPAELRGAALSEASESEDAPAAGADAVEGDDRCACPDDEGDDKREGEDEARESGDRDDAEARAEKDGNCDDDKDGDEGREAKPGIEWACVKGNDDGEPVGVLVLELVTLGDEKARAETVKIPFKCDTIEVRIVGLRYDAEYQVAGDFYSKHDLLYSGRSEPFGAASVAVPLILAKAEATQDPSVKVDVEFK